MRRFKIAQISNTGMLADETAGRRLGARPQQLNHVLGSRTLAVPLRTMRSR